MDKPKHWIRVEIVGEVKMKEGWDMLWNGSTTPEQMAKLNDFMCSLAGFDGTEYSRGLRGEYEQDPEQSGTQALYQANMLRGFMNTERKFKSDWRENADLEKYTLYMEYNPEDWCKSGKKRWLAYPAGRIVALAYLGVLKQQGFKVNGSNLPAEVCSE